MVTKSPNLAPRKDTTEVTTTVVPAGEPLQVTVRRKARKKSGGSTALGLVLAMVAAGAAWFGWQLWQHGEQMPAPVVREGVVVFDGFGEQTAADGIPVITGLPLAESSTVVDVVEEATPVTTSEEVLPTSATIVALPISPSQAVVAAGETLGTVAVSPVVVETYSPRAELASQLGLLIAAAKSNLSTTPELARALIPWAEQAGDGGLVALLTPLAEQNVAVAEPETHGPEWLQRWVVIRKKTAPSYAADPVVLETLIQYYIRNYVSPAKAPVPSVEAEAPTVTI
jgi:hypothetical protein